MIKVSVVVPVYNPGADMDDLVKSVLNQSLDTSEYEVIFVDDSSTDGTGERLDALAADFDFIRVEHIPNSGWPGKPRNVGTDLARGEFVLYVDNDDYITPEALERMYDRAVADDVDVLMGKVVGHRKYVARELFLENRSRISLEWAPLVRLLSPHKLFRTSFLREHDIRFPDQPAFLEDHVVVMKAYFAAGDRISVLADYPCYHWMLRGEKDNASYGMRDPARYYNDLRRVLDLIEAQSEGRERERLLAHWYRSKVLFRFTGQTFLRRGEELGKRIFEECHAVAVERFPPEIDRFVPFAQRARSTLLRAGDLDGLYAFARWEASLKPRLVARQVTRGAREATVDLEAQLIGMNFRQDGETLFWAPPEDLERVQGIDFTASVGRAHATPVLRSTSDQTEVVQAHESEVRVVPAGDGLVTPVIASRITVTPPAPGEWQLVTTVRISGLNKSGMTVVQPGAKRAAPLTFRVRANGTFARPSWARRHLSGRAPRTLRRLLTR